MMKLHNFAIIGILAALLIVPFQFEIYAPKGHHLSQYYGYAFLFNPPSRTSIYPYTTSVLWERVFIEILAICLVNYLFFKIFPDYNKTTFKKDFFSSVGSEFENWLLIQQVNDKFGATNVYLDGSSIIWRSEELEFVYAYTYQDTINIRKITCHPATHTIIHKNSDNTHYGDVSPVGKCVTFILNNKLGGTT